MGNCQAAEAATVVIQRRQNGGAGAGWTVERIYWSVSAQQVMASNPGYYVASVTTVSAGPDGALVRHLKLLRPDDTLHIGHVYRLVSFQGPPRSSHSKAKKVDRTAEERRQQQRRQQGETVEASKKVERSGGGGGGRQRQWRPALHSIAEVGS